MINEEQYNKLVKAYLKINISLPVKASELTILDYCRLMRLAKNSDNKITKITIDIINSIINKK